MKWFILFFIILFGLVSILAFLNAGSSMAYYWVAISILVLVGILIIWRSAYFQHQEVAKAKSVVLGHSIIMLGVGAALSLVGVTSYLSKNCPFDGCAYEGRLLSELSCWAETNSLCGPYAITLVILGVAVLFPSLKLHFRLVMGHA